MQKKLISIVLAVLICAAVLPIFATAAADSGYLSNLSFGSSTTAASKGNLALDKPFNSETHDYTLYIKDSISSVSVWATLSSAGTGKAINCKYKKTTGADNTVEVTSGNTTGKSLASLIKAKDFTGNTVTVEVGTQTYNITVVRQATLSALSLSVRGNTVALNEKFAAATTEYSAFIPYGEKITAACTATVADGTTVTLGDKAANEEYALDWDKHKKATALIAVYKTDSETTTKTVYTVNISATPVIDGVEGVGSASSPYLLKKSDDLKKLSELVKSGYTFAGASFEFANDITLPSSWEPLGTAVKSGNYYKNDKVFSGNIDGKNHTLTVPKGEKTLIGVPQNASLKNLKIYGAEINGAGVVDNYCQGAKSTTITIDNVTLLSGTKTLKSGFLGGYASGSDVVYIKNCTIEKGVTVGFDGSESNIGSFAGEFNGVIENSKSAATVKGVDFVGGIIGNKGQTMGKCDALNCEFSGEIAATGNYVGGITGHAYGGTGFGWATAPNSPCVVIKNCKVTGKITGKNYVGGILGADACCVQCWDNGIGEISGNRFEGTVTATEENAYLGAVVGFFGSINKNTVFEDNTYLEGCGTDKGIGGALYVDTNNESPTAIDGVTYVDTSKGNPGIKGITRYAPSYEYYRTDDPFGKDIEKLFKQVKKEEKKAEDKKEPEKIPEDKKQTTEKSPDTSDKSPLLLYLVILAFAGLVISAFKVKAK